MLVIGLKTLFAQHVRLMRSELLWNITCKREHWYSLCLKLSNSDRLNCSILTFRLLCQLLSRVDMSTWIFRHNGKITLKNYPVLALSLPLSMGKNDVARQHENEQVQNAPINERKNVKKARRWNIKWENIPCWYSHKANGPHSDSPVMTTAQKHSAIFM